MVEKNAALPTASDLITFPQASPSGSEYCRFAHRLSRVAPNSTQFPARSEGAYLLSIAHALYTHSIKTEPAINLQGALTIYIAL